MVLKGVQAQSGHQPQGTGPRETAVRFLGVTKRYGPATVVNSVDLTVASGEVHALVGANGAGKSTLLGILSGRTDVTEGAVEVFGSTLPSGSPRASRALGVATVYQELTIIPTLSAAANVFLGNELRHHAWLRQKEMDSRFRRLCQEFGIEVDASVPAGVLPVATQQVLEILRVIQRAARVVILDEPTAALSQSERDALLRLVRQLAQRGITIILVSHNLGEVLSVSDTVSVMRGGRLVRTAAAGDWDRESLIHAMTGEVMRPVMRDPRPQVGDVVLEASHITVSGAISDVSVSVRAGEIVGLAGLVGSGRTTTLRALAGAQPVQSGEIKIDGKPRRWPRSVRRAVVDLGIALVPEERKRDGLHVNRSVPDNVTMTDLRAASRAGMVNRDTQLERARDLLGPLQLSRAVGAYPVAELSGGNQQKVAVAKWLHRSPRVLLFDEPTRGIDVAAKVQVMAAIRNYARAGNAVIMTSSEIEEVLEIADRMLVLSAGELVAELDLHDHLPTTRQVLDLSFERMG